MIKWTWKRQSTIDAFSIGAGAFIGFEIDRYF
jgi:hypothetical protein